MSTRSDGGWAGPLAAHAAGFRAELVRLGYSTSATDRHVFLMAHVNRWLVRERLDMAGWRRRVWSRSSRPGARRGM